MVSVEIRLFKSESEYQPKFMPWANNGGLGFPLHTVSFVVKGARG